MNVKLNDSCKLKIEKALRHLEYSFKKIQTLPVGPVLTEEQLEVWESFSARLSRVVDLYLTKYLKLRVRMEDPAFDGSLRDFCNFGEKIGLIEDVDAWLELRELRNPTAHDYTDEDLAKFFERLKECAPRALAIASKL